MKYKDEAHEVDDVQQKANCLLKVIDLTSGKGFKGPLFEQLHVLDTPQFIDHKSV